MSAPLIQGGPSGYFIQISITTPAVSALRNYYNLYLELFLSTVGVPADTLYHFWIQVAVSLLKLKPPNGSFRSETADTQLFRK
jgi:hypothetical protein